MVGRLLVCVALVTIGAVVGAYWDALAASTLFFHPGRVVEHIARNPLDASLTAWPDANLSQANGSCPVSTAKALDAQTSVGGDFRIRIDQGSWTYALVYCRNGYVPRVDVLANSRDGTPVRPWPVELWPAKISEDENEAFDDEIDAIVTSFLNNISYMRTVSESRFEQAIKRLAGKFEDKSKGRATVISNLQTVAGQWRSGNAK